MANTVTNHKIAHKGASVIIDRALRYVEKNPEKNLLKMARIAKKLAGDTFPENAYKGMVNLASDKDNTWHKFTMRLLDEVDHNVIKKSLLAFGLHGAVYGTKEVRTNREKYGCNIPFLILFDPTSSCNLKCKGCWSAEYDRKLNLSMDEMRSIVAQGKQLGTHMYLMTGGEPLMRKKDILTLAEENQDCVFLAFTNGTLVDEEFAKRLKEVGNLILAISIEGNIDTTDARRGNGVYQRARNAMALLKEQKCLFGISVCYTRQNLDTVVSDEFLDDMIESGVRFGMYFHYMPVGTGADKEMLLTPSQREKIYHRIREMRTSKGGKPMFLMDFQNDGEFVGGCIAGGRNYFHINSAGDMEPCVFIHYSDSNIREKSILDALKSPLFMAYYHNQPFNDNHLRPCPMLENPSMLRRIVSEAGAHSTDMIAKESADALCDKCESYAKNWKQTAEKLWLSNDHYRPFTQYYRDLPESEDK